MRTGPIVHHDWLRRRWQACTLPAALDELADELRDAMEEGRREWLDDVAADPVRYGTIPLAARRAGISIEAIEEALGSL